MASAAGSGATPCLFGDCAVTFDLGANDADTQLLERHLMEAHCLVIEAIVDIADLHSYLTHWRQFISGDTAKVHCFVFHPGPADDDSVAAPTPEAETAAAPANEYLFLSYDNPDDARLRARLHEKRLAEVTELYQQERQSRENFPCIFCNDISLSRQKIFEHLAEEHSFYLGDPDNMVFVGELLRRLGDMISANICLYCEKEFRTRFVLKEHMRKRNHRRVKPQGSGAKYGRYFIANYLEPGGLHRASVSIGVDAAPASAGDSEDDEEEDDDSGQLPSHAHAREDTDRELLPTTTTMTTTTPTTTEADGGAIVAALPCPLCAAAGKTATAADAPGLLRHLAERHSVDLPELSRRHGLDFYQRLRLLALLESRPRDPPERLAAELANAAADDYGSCCRAATELEVTLADLCDEVD